MTPDLVIGVLERVAELWAPAAEAAWQITMRQVQVCAYTNAAWGLIGLATLGFGVWLMPKTIHFEAEYCDDEEKRFALGVLSAILLCAGFIVAGACFTGAFGRFINPEWYAVQLLLGMAAG